MYKYWNNKREEGEDTLRRTDYNWEEIMKVTDAKHIYAGDVILKATNANQIYGKLEAFGGRRG